MVNHDLVSEEASEKDKKCVGEQCAQEDEPFDLEPEESPRD